jgi:hypothetical protein
MTCSCGWVTAAETIEEIVILLDVHKRQASAGQMHSVAIKGRLDISHPPASPRRPSA